MIPNSNVVTPIKGDQAFLGQTVGARFRGGGAPAVGFGQSQPLGERIAGNLSNSGHLKPVIMNETRANRLDMEA